MGGSREYTLDLYVKSSAHMWGGCIHEWASGGGRKQGSGAYREVARVSIPPTAVSYPDSTGGPEYYPQKLTGVALGGSPHDVHPAVG